MSDSNTRRVVPSPTAPYERGNIDLNNRPKVKNPDGSYSTIRSLTFTDDDNHAILVPSVVGNKVVSNEAAWQNYVKTGQHLGKFYSTQAADRYAEQLHNQQAIQYGGSGIKSNQPSLSNIKQAAQQRMRQK